MYNHNIKVHYAKFFKGVIIMDFIINENIKEQFEYYTNMCELLCEYKDSSFAPPADIAKIEEWEKENKFSLPNEYKSWLMLTENADILNQYAVIQFPESGDYKDENDVIIVGTVLNDEELLLSRSTNVFFRVTSDGEQEYRDFDDMLADLSFYLEECAEDCIGENWDEVYDERFES